MYKKLITMFFLLILSFGCDKKMEIIENDYVLLCSIYPVGTTSESYLFKINKNGEYNVWLGTRTNEKINTKKYLEDYVTLKKNLSKLELEQLNEKLRAIKRKLKMDLGSVQKDAWKVKIIINGNEYQFYYLETDDEKLKEVIKFIIEQSPMKVDIHSWS